MPVFFCSRKDIQAGDKRNKNKHLTRLLCLAGSRAKAVHAFMDIPPTCSVLAVNGSSIKHTKPRVKSGVSTADTVCTFHVVFLIFDFFFFYHTSSIPGELRCNRAICQLHGWRKMKTERRWTHFGEMILNSEAIQCICYAVRAFCCHALNALVSAERMLQNDRKRAPKTMKTMLFQKQFQESSTQCTFCVLLSNKVTAKEKHYQKILSKRNPFYFP